MATTRWAAAEGDMASLISTTFAEYLGFEPRPFQIDGVRLLVWRHGIRLCLVRKTGDGKTYVFYIAGILLGGVSLSIIPVVGLGAEQAERARNTEKGVDAYHLDQLSGPMVQRVKTMLKEAKVGDRRSIFLFCSPQALRPGSAWGAVISDLLDRGVLRLVMVDEFHLVPEWGRYFRSEFAELKDNIFSKLSDRVAFVAATGTCTKADKGLIW